MCGGHVCIYKCLCILVHVFLGWGQPWVLFLSRHWHVGFRVLTESWGFLIGLCAETQESFFLWFLELGLQTHPIPNPHLPLLTWVLNSDLYVCAANTVWTKISPRPQSSLLKIELAILHVSVSERCYSMCLALMKKNHCLISGDWEIQHEDMTRFGVR